MYAIVALSIIFVLSSLDCFESLYQQYLSSFHSLQGERKCSVINQSFNIHYQHHMMECEQIIHERKFLHIKLYKINFVYLATQIYIKVG